MIPNGALPSGMEKLRYRAPGVIRTLDLLVRSQRRTSNQELAALRMDAKHAALFNYFRPMASNPDKCCCAGSGHTFGHT